MFVCCTRTWMHLKDFWSSGSYVFSIAFFGLPTPDHRLPFSVLCPLSSVFRLPCERPSGRDSPTSNSRPEGRLYGPLPFCKPPVFHRDLTACLYSALSRGFPAPQPRCNSLHRSNSPTRLWLSLATLLLVRCRSNRWFIGVLAIKKWFPPGFRLLIHVTFYAAARAAIRPPAEEWPRPGGRSCSPTPPPPDSCRGAPPETAATDSSGQSCRLNAGSPTAPRG